MSLTQNAPKSIPIAGEHITQIDYDGGTDPVYIGKADSGMKDSDAKWLIQKITYTAGDITLIQSANDVAWDDRTSALYS